MSKLSLLLAIKFNITPSPSLPPGFLCVSVGLISIDLLQLCHLLLSAAQPDSEAEGTCVLAPLRLRPLVKMSKAGPKGNRIG